MYRHLKYITMTATWLLSSLIWLAAGSVNASAQQTAALVDAQWLKANINNPDIRIVDVSKKPEDFEKGHILNALAVNRKLDLADTTVLPPNRYPHKVQFEQLMGRLGITPNTTVVAYDDNKSMYATRLITIMQAYGHNPDKLKVLDGGWVYWGSNDYPIETGPAKMPAPSNYKATRKLQESLVTTADIYQDVVMGARPEVMLMDARPEKEYTAKKIRAVRGGNIPGSINLTGENFMSSDDHRMKPLQEIRKMVEDAGFSKDKQIYVYCHSGDRSAHVYWMLTNMLGYKHVSVNDSGWNGWAETLSYPANQQVWAWQNK